MKREDFVMRWGGYGLDIAFESVEGEDDNTYSSIYQEISKHLNVLERQVDEVKERNFSMIREVFVRAEKSEMLREVRQRFYEYVGSILKTAEDIAQKAKGEMLSQSAVKRSEEGLDAAGAVILSHKREAALKHILSLEPEERFPWIQEQLQNGDLTPLHAAMDSYRQILSPEHIEELQVRWATKVKPESVQAAMATQARYEAIRERLATGTSVAKSILRKNKIDDPVSWQEHFDVLNPRTEMQAHYADEIIRRDNQLREAEQRRLEWAESHPGIDLETGTYIDGGPPPVEPTEAPTIPH